MNLIKTVQAALVVWTFSHLQVWKNRKNEITIEIDSLSIDASKSDILRIERLIEERRDIVKLLDIVHALLG